MSTQSANSVLPDPGPAMPAPPPLRRLAWKLVLLVLAKLVVLTLIWWVATAPYPRPDTHPAAIEQLLAPASASSTSHADHP